MRSNLSELSAAGLYPDCWELSRKTKPAVSFRISTSLLSQELLWLRLTRCERFHYSTAACKSLDSKISICCRFRNLSQGALYLCYIKGSKPNWHVFINMVGIFILPDFPSYDMLFHRYGDIVDTGNKTWVYCPGGLKFNILKNPYQVCGS